MLYKKTIVNAQVRIRESDRKNQIPLLILPYDCSAKERLSLQNQRENLPLSHSDIYVLYEKDCECEKYFLRLPCLFRLLVCHLQKSYLDTARSSSVDRNRYLKSFSLLLPFETPAHHREEDFLLK